MALEQIVSALPDIRLLPPLTAPRIDDLERSRPGPLPNDVKDLLRHAGGLEAPHIGKVDFTGRSLPFEYPEIVPRSVALAQVDGTFWVVDVDAGGEWGHVLHFSHDPPVVIVPFASFADFLRAIARPRTIVDNAAHSAKQVWQRTDEGTMVADAAESDDDSLSGFATSLTGDFTIFDLRAPATKPIGFTWGRSGPDSEIRRAGSSLLFAVAP